jgi:ferrochelatase
MTGLLLINLGTPAAPTTREVRRYLRQFLSDPRVIDIHPIGRSLLLNLIILPFRPRKSAEAYRKVWTDRGSPLLYHSQDLVTAVQERLGPSWKVVLGMRYGQPSLPATLAQLAQARCERLVVLPLYPQYSSAATGSSVEEVMRVLSAEWVTPPVDVLGTFYDHPGFIEAFARVGEPVIRDERPDHVLFSYHGLPERQVQRCDPTGAHCLKSATCCDRLVDANRDCYRAQCYATTRALAKRLGLTPDRHSVAFQSRLGRTPWILPHTDVELVTLAKERGVKRLVVFSPAFVADCLETLEEIGIRAKESFLGAGGESLALVPSLNATAPWADAVVQLVRRPPSAL